MYTIKRAAQLTGVSEATLRAWERRYGAWVPERSESGYRLYDLDAIAVILTMRRLVLDGWSPAAAAKAVGSGAVAVTPGSEISETDETVATSAQPEAEGHTERFLDAAARLDITVVDECLDAGFGLGSFEHVVDSWLFPTLAALGAAWARGEVDVAGEHAASHAVQRRLSAAFDAAGNRSRGSAVVVGLPSGSQHELGALAFATAIRRAGMNVLYLGPNVPASSWEIAVTRHAARAVVLAVVTPEDRPAAATVAELLVRHELDPAVCAGGAAAIGLAPSVHELGSSISGATRQLDQLLHAGR